MYFLINNNESFKKSEHILFFDNIFWKIESIIEINLAFKLSIIIVLIP